MANPSSSSKIYRQAHLNRTQIYSFFIGVIPPGSSGISAFTRESFRAGDNLRWDMKTLMRAGEELSSVLEHTLLFSSATTSSHILSGPFTSSKCQITASDADSEAAQSGL